MPDPIITGDDTEPKTVLDARNTKVLADMAAILVDTFDGESPENKKLLYERVIKLVEENDPHTLITLYQDGFS